MKGLVPGVAKESVSVDGFKGSYAYAIQRRNVFWVLLMIVGLSMIRPAFNMEKKSQARSQALSPEEFKHGSVEVHNASKQVIGIDVSHYDGDIDWETVQSQGVQFAYLKASQGTGYSDPKYQQNIKGLSRTNILYGAYHFFMPQEDPVQQAQYFLSVAGDNHLLRPVLDIEISGGVNSGEIRNHALMWLKRVESELGCTPLIYTNHFYWNEHLDDQFVKYPLWLADYAVKPKLPKGVASWAIWQKTDKGRVHGISTNVDKNVINGNITTLKGLRCHRELP